MTGIHIDFNELNRKLDGHVSPTVHNIITQLYLMISELQKQQDMTGKIVLGMSDTMGQIVELHGRTVEQINLLKRYGRQPGVDVRSEPAKGHAGD